MSRRILDHDPSTGITTFHHYDSSKDETIIEEVADLQALHEHRYELRKDEDATKAGIKAGQWLYAQIHPIEQTKFLRKYGFSVFSQGREKEVYKILNTDPDFQLCKTTAGIHT